MAISFSSARLLLISSSFCGETVSVYLSDNNFFASELTASSPWSPVLSLQLLTSSSSLSKKRESSSNRVSPPNVLCNLKSYNVQRCYRSFTLISRTVIYLWYRAYTYGCKFHAATKSAKSTTNTSSPAFPSNCGLTVKRWSDLSSPSSPSCSLLPSLSLSNPSHELALKPEICSA